MRLNRIRPAAVRARERACELPGDSRADETEVAGKIARAVAIMIVITVTIEMATPGANGSDGDTAITAIMVSNSSYNIVTAAMTTTMPVHIWLL